MGHFSPRRQTNMRKLRLSCRKKGKFEALKGFGSLKTFLQALEIIVSTPQQKENQFIITKKNNKPNQKLTEIVVCRGEFNNNAKMVSKSLNKVIP